jgi:flagellar basal-body rod modification protein FlgD
MQITNDVSQAASAAAATPPASAASAAASSAGGMVNEQTFLQLLVSQIKNQDPLSPTDSMQFVSQLAQFSSLEQLIGIHESLNSLTHLASSGTPTPPSSGQ